MHSKRKLIAYFSFVAGTNHFRVVLCIVVAVLHVKINPVDTTQCLDGQQCTINQTVRCTAEGNPKPVTFNWLISVNGSGVIMTETSDDQFTFTTTGHYEVQCIAFNQFAGTRYNTSSSVFTTRG